MNLINYKSQYWLGCEYKLSHNNVIHYLVHYEFLSNHGDIFCYTQMYKISNHQIFYIYSNVQ